MAIDREVLASAIYNRMYAIVEEEIGKWRYANDGDVVHNCEELIGLAEVLKAIASGSSRIHFSPKSRRD